MRILFCLFFFLATSIFPATINVLDSANNHAVGGVVGVNATYITSLAGVNFSLYDAIYIDEHSSSTFLSGQETNIRNAMINNGLALVAEYTDNTVLGQISTILGLGTALAAGTNAIWSNNIADHPILTGAGLDGGAAVNILGLYNNSYTQIAFNYLPSGAQMVVKTSGGAPVLIAGTLGAGRYVLFGYEALETAGVAEKQLIHNALFWATNTPVPEPSTCLLMIVALMGMFKFYRR